MALLELLVAGAVLAANAYVKGKSSSSDEEWEEMDTRGKMDSILDATRKDVEKKVNEVEKRVVSELKRKSDNEIRQIIRQTSNENTRRLAEEEAERRGISY